jgi:hypothetical protein
LVPAVEPSDVERIPSTAVAISRTPLNEGSAAVLLVDDYDGLSITQSLRWSPGDHQGRHGSIRAVASARTDQLADLDPALQVLNDRFDVLGVAS